MAIAVNFHAPHELKLLFFEFNTDTLDQSLNLRDSHQTLEKRMAWNVALRAFSYLIIFNLTFSRNFFFNFYLFIYLFIHLWLCWVFVSVLGLSPAAASGGHSSSRCAGLSPQRPLLLQSTGSRCAGSVVVAHGLSCSVACGIFPDQGPNPCPLHWQADSQPLRHQGSPSRNFISLFSRNLISLWKK